MTNQEGEKRLRETIGQISAGDAQEIRTANYDALIVLLGSIVR